MTALPRGLSARARSWLRPELGELAAYQVTAAGDRIKLDAMENPYGWPEELIPAWQERLAAIPLNRYPDGSGTRLREALVATLGLPDDLGLLLGNGSDELIQLLVQAVARPGHKVLAPEPTFVMYRHLARANGLDFVGVPLGPDFDLDREAMVAACRREQPALVFLAWPNNPTGNLFDPSAVRAVIDAAPGLVVMDEAYEPFAQASYAAVPREHDHVLVLRTLSKLGLAGLRLGYLMGAPGLVTELDKLRLPYNINALSEATAVFALEHYGMLAGQAERIRTDRESLAERLAAVPGVERVWPSAANFLLFQVQSGSAQAVHAGLAERGVLIKNLSGSHPQLADCLRVTVGQPAENEAFLEALGATLRDGP